MNLENMDFSEFQHLKLFEQMSISEIRAAFQTLEISQRKYRKGASIMKAGKTTDSFGLVVSGHVIAKTKDVLGNQTDITCLEKGQCFCVSFALHQSPLPFDIVAGEASHILLIPTTDFRDLGLSSRHWVIKFLNTLLEMTSEENINLSLKNIHTSPKTIRSRILTYLGTLEGKSINTELNKKELDKSKLKKLESDKMELDKEKAGEKEFDIPLSRQELADYLNIDRTALSKELGKMQQEGILSFRKNHFVIY